MAAAPAAGKEVHPIVPVMVALVAKGADVNSRGYVSCWYIGMHGVDAVANPRLHANASTGVAC